MREDQHAGRAGGLDEARGGDRLPRRRWVPEPVAAHGARIGADVRDDLVIEVEVDIDMAVLDRSHR